MNQKIVMIVGHRVYLLVHAKNNCNKVPFIFPFQSLGKECQSENIARLAAADFEK